MFDKQRCKAIGKLAEAALKTLGQDEKVGFHYVGGNFAGGEFTMKISVREIDSETGKEADPLEEDFKKFATRYGLKPDMLGAEFTYSGRTMLVKGLRTKARTAPIVAKDAQNGKLYKLTAEDVRRALKDNEQTVPVKRSAAAS